MLSTDTPLWGHVCVLRAVWGVSSHPRCWKYLEHGEPDHLFLDRGDGRVSGAPWTWDRWEVKIDVSHGDGVDGGPGGRLAARWGNVVVVIVAVETVGRRDGMDGGGVLDWLMFLRGGPLASS